MLGVNGDVVSYNLFGYCGCNPVNRTDENGKDWRDFLAIGTAILVIGIAAAAIVSTGGVGAAVLAGVGVTASVADATVVTGLLISGSSILFAISENSKPTSRNQMQKQVEEGKAPKEVDRVDPPHVGTGYNQNHIHFKDNTVINMDGSASHVGRGIASISRAVIEWMLENNWGWLLK